MNPATWITYRCNRVRTKRNAVVAVTHICVGDLTIIGADNGLSPGRRQAIIWTNDGILLIGPLGTNFSEILIEICIFYFKKMHLKVSPAKWRPFCLWPHCVKEEENREENGEVEEVDNEDGFEKFHSADCDIRWLGRTESVKQMHTCCTQPMVLVFYLGASNRVYSVLTWLNVRSNAKLHKVCMYYGTPCEELLMWLYSRKIFVITWPNVCWPSYDIENKQ